MSEVKAVLFDADGVTITPSEPFSVQYANERGFDPATIQPFFSGDFQAAMIGKADLKDLLERHRDTWHWDGDVEELMQRWFNAENHPNTKLVELITNLRKQGLRCYLATNQEKYRTSFIRNTMFPDVFDDVFSSAEIGATKPSEAYFNEILGTLAVDGIKADEVAYFDDSEGNVQAASRLGIKGYVYSDDTDVKAILSNPETSVDKEMKAEDVVEIVKLCEQNGIEVYVDGGWGIDALLGEQTRKHGDLDIALPHKHVPKLRELLQAKGYKDIPRNDTTDSNFVLGDDNGHEIDFHSYTFDENGNNVYGVAYEPRHLTGTGTINGYSVKCIPADVMIEFHSGYELDENDYHDVKALCDKFGLPLPPEYSKFEEQK